jgi:hypothetical protein
MGLGRKVLHCPSKKALSMFCGESWLLIIKMTVSLDSIMVLSRSMLRMAFKASKPLCFGIMISRQTRLKGCRIFIAEVKELIASSPLLTAVTLKPKLLNSSVNTSRKMESSSAIKADLLLLVLITKIPIFCGAIDSFKQLIGC